MSAASSAAAAIPLKDSGDVVRARRLVQSILTGEKLRPVRVTGFATAVSEVARNAIIHAGGGQLRIREEDQNERRVLIVTVTDSGPGIDNIEQAMSDGYSTKKSLGLGLGGAKRLSHALSVTSSPDSGTTVELVCLLP